MGRTSLTLPSQTGESGKYLKTDGANASWEEVTEVGDVAGPATNTADYIPQWDGANSKTLKDGLAVPAGGLAGLTALGDKVDKSTYDANSILYATTDNTPVALTVGTNTVVGRVAGAITTLAVDSDLSSVSANDDTIPSAKATKSALDLKAPSISPTFATSITGSYLTASEVLITDADKKIVSAPVATYPSLTELSYVKGVTSAVQTQLGDKSPIANPTFTGTVTLPTVQLGEASIKLDSVLSADEKWSGITTSGTLGATIAVGDLCYLNADDSRWELVDANLSDGYDKQLGICLLAGNDGDATEMLVFGKVRSAAFPAFTVGSPLYVSETAGDITHTQPTTADVAIRLVGFALTAEDLLFNPSNDYIIKV